jgi:CheY-like chemotaxis protein
VESSPGVGSRFSFDLTFDTIKENEVIQAGEIVLDELEKPNFEGEVLICEDNSMSQQVICEHLARVGLSSVIAVNGREGVDLVARRLKNNEKPFDLIFMDIHMPIMDGMEAAFKITSLGSMTPIIAMTANIMSNEVEAYKENGMPYCLNKPFTSRELWKCLLKYLKPVSYSAVDKSRQAADDEKLQKHLKINFVKENQATAAMIANAIEAGDLKLAQRLAHTLKTNSGQIGKNRLREAAADIEGILKEGKYLPSSSQIKELEAILKTVLDELAPLLAGDEGSNVSKTIDKDEVIKLLNQLEEMLANKNPKCMNLIDEIRVIPGSRELVKKIEDFEFKQGLEELLKLKEKLYGQ